MSVCRRERDEVGVCFPEYAELHRVTNFSFPRGASHPEELVDRAGELSYGGCNKRWMLP
jgi:hypothetical protein